MGIRLYTLYIDEQLAGIQIGTILQKKIKASRRLLRQLSLNNGVRKNGEIAYLSARAQLGDIIHVTLPVETSEISAECLELNIVYEDDEIVVVNKQAGVLTHPTARERGGSLIGGLVYHFKSSHGVPHAVHRLDRDTSGLVMIAKNAHAHHLFDIALRENGIDRRYAALVYVGTRHAASITDWQTICAPIAQNPNKPSRRIISEDGQVAVTHYRFLAYSGKVGVVELKLDTGRTHQIRLHMATLGLPLLGDRDYTMEFSGYSIPADAESYSRFMKRQALHAYQLCWTHPLTEEIKCVTAAPPADMTELWEELGGNPLVWNRLLSDSR